MIIFRLIEQPIVDFQVYGRFFLLMGVHFNKNLLSIDIGRVENFFKIGTQDKSNCPISTRGIKL